MRACVIDQPNSASMVDVPEPEIRPGEALVRVSYNTFCGSDLSLYKGHWHGFAYPVTPGHEWSGVVVDAGDSDSGPSLSGRRVVCDLRTGCGACRYCREGASVLCPDLEELGFTRPGAAAELVAVPRGNIHLLPDALTLLAATQVEPLAVAMHAVASVDLSAGEVAVVLGAGGIGLLLVQAARLRGATVVLVSEPIESRREGALRCGAQACTELVGADLASSFDTLSPVRPDVVFEASGYMSAVAAAVDIVRPGGRIALVGYRVEDGAQFSAWPLVTKAVRTVGVLGPAGEFSAAIDALAGGHVVVDPILTHHTDIEGSVEALDRGVRRADGVVRTAVCCGG